MIAIMTDSNSGITQEMAKNLNITVVPMPFFINGEEYLEDINLSQEDFYKFLLGGANVSTSQPSIGYVTSIWDELLKTHEAVIYIPMSSGLSKSCETASVASQADEYNGKVFVVNNKRISVTQLASVIDAKKLAEKGYDAKSIKDILEKNGPNSDILIMLDTLEYLKKGGRITASAAAIGGMLKLKPILMIEGEKLDKYKMRNRSIENAKSIMIDGMMECVNGYLKEIDNRVDNIKVYMAYTGTDKTEINKFEEEANKAFANLNLKVEIVNPLSLSISCHIGDGAIAIAVEKIPHEVE